MAQKRLGGKYFTTRTEIDLDCCKQMSAHNVTRGNRMYMVLLVIVIAAAWFWKTRSAGTKIWMDTVQPTGLEYLIREI